MVNNPLWW